MSSPATTGPGRATRAGVLVGSGRLTTGLLSFVALLLAARLLEPADYGLLALVLVSSSVLYALLASWSSMPVYVLAAEELRDHGTMAETSAARLVMTGGLALVAIVMLLLARALGVLDGVDRVLILAWAAAGVGYTVCEHVTSLLETKGAYAGSVAVQLVRPLVWGLGLLALVVSGTGGLVPVLWVLVLSWAITAGFALILASRLPLRPLRTSGERIAVLAAAAAPLMVHAVSQLLFGSVDLYVLRAFATTHEVGVYGLAYQCFGMATLVSSAVFIVVTPRLAGHAAPPTAARTYLVALEARALPLLGVAVTLLVPWVAPTAGVLFGAAYRDAGPPLVVLTLAFLVTAATTALAPVLLLGRAFRLLAGVAALAVVLNTMLDLILVGALGLGVTAPAVATLVALTFSWFVYRRRAFRDHGLHPAVTMAAVTGPPVVAAVASLTVPTVIAGGVGAALGAGQLALALRRSRYPASSERSATGAPETPDERP